MIEIVKNKNQLGIILFWDFIGLIIHKSKEEMFSQFAITFRIYKFDLTISLGKEKINVKDINKAIKESKNYDAFA